MKRIIIAALLPAALAGSSLAWADSKQAAADADPKIGTHITITGCLHQGTSSGSYVLLGITERPAGAPASVQLAPYAIYWLDSNDGLKKHVGEIVDITGKVKSRRPEKGTITVSFDPSEKRSTNVQVESANKDLDVTSTDYNNGAQPAGSENARVTDVQRNVYVLDVETVSAVTVPVAGPACR